MPKAKIGTNTAPPAETRVESVRDGRRKPGPPPGEPRELLAVKVPVGTGAKLKAYAWKRRETMGAVVVRALARELGK